MTSRSIRVALVLLPVVLLATGAYLVRGDRPSRVACVVVEGWQPYQGAFRSGVVAYQIGPDFIRIRFRQGRVYTYSANHIPAAKIEHMKYLAKAGQGLNTFINQNPDVRFGYER